MARIPSRRTAALLAGVAAALAAALVPLLRARARRGPGDGAPRRSDPRQRATSPEPLHTARAVAPNVA